MSEPQTTIPTEPTPRTAAGIRERLFQTLDGLMDDSVSPGKARSVAAVASAAIATVQLELDVHRLQLRQGQQVEVPEHVKKLTGP